MSIPNNRRILVQLVKEICADHGIDCQAISEDWIIKLEKNSQKHFIYGYNFNLNGSATQLIANDKSATNDLLALANIPTVSHELFLNPTLLHYVEAKGNWQRMLNFVETHGFPIVCKANTGTGGNDLFFVHSQQELEIAAKKIFTKERALALSPYFEITAEHRFIILNGQCELSYRKIRPAVIGDGQASLFHLISDYCQKHQLPIANYVSDLPYPLETVLPKTETCFLSQKHNLSKGAIVELVENPSLTALALKAADTINLQFGAVDIIESDNNYQVLEINAGVMMESLVKRLPEGRQMAKLIYQKAILSIFKAQTL